eukprot:6469185-Amphidinium_carterae.1
MNEPAYDVARFQQMGSTPNVSTPCKCSIAGGTETGSRDLMPHYMIYWQAPEEEPNGMRAGGVVALRQRHQGCARSLIHSLPQS